MFDNAFYNGGFEELTMDEQAEYIKVLKDVTGFANFYDAGESYTPYVPFVVELFLGYVSNYIMVRFFTVLSLASYFIIFSITKYFTHIYVFNRESLVENRAFELRLIIPHY